MSIDAILWRPIETAPKSGRIRVLLYRPSAPEWWRVMGGHWDADDYAKKPRPYWAADNWALHKIEQRNHEPTHWAPMPGGPS